VPEEDIVTALRRAIAHTDGLASWPVRIDDAALRLIARAAAGDVRQALSDLERAVHHASAGTVTADDLPALLRERSVRHDRDGEDHFNVLSALIKSMRGSDPDAAVYWLARLVAAGEPPSLIARRLVIFASEDVGNADPRALQLATSTLLAVEKTGYPEARIILAQAVLWLACSPKSNAVYLAIDRALEEVRRSGAQEVPGHLRNTPPPGSPAYQYPHDHPDHIVDQQYLPTRLEGSSYYEPKSVAEEKVIRDRLAWWKRRLAERG
jgi:putative ATPase